MKPHQAKLCTIHPNKVQSMMTGATHIQIKRSGDSRLSYEDGSTEDAKLSPELTKAAFNYCEYTECLTDTECECPSWFSIVEAVQSQRKQAV
jgi:hypothetical protein